MIIWLCMWSQTTNNNNNNNNNNDKTNNSYMIRLRQMVELFLGQTHKKYIYIYIYIDDDDDNDDDVMMMMMMMMAHNTVEPFHPAQPATNE